MYFSFSHAQARYASKVIYFVDIKREKSYFSKSEHRDMTEFFGEGNKFWLLRNDFCSQPQAAQSGESICKSLNALVKFIVSGSNKISP